MCQWTKIKTENTVDLMSFVILNKDSKSAHHQGHCNGLLRGGVSLKLSLSHFQIILLLLNLFTHLPCQLMSLLRDPSRLPISPPSAHSGLPCWVICFQLAHPAGVLACCLHSAQSRLLRVSHWCSTLSFPFAISPVLLPILKILCSLLPLNKSYLSLEGDCESCFLEAFPSRLIPGYTEHFFSELLRPIVT